MQLSVLFTGVLSKRLLLLLAAPLVSAASECRRCVYYTVNLWPLQLFTSPFVSFGPNAQTEETATEYKSVLDHREVKQETAGSLHTRVFLEHLWRNTPTDCEVSDSEWMWTKVNQTFHQKTHMKVSVPAHGFGSFLSAGFQRHFPQNTVFIQTNPSKTRDAPTVKNRYQCFPAVVFILFCIPVSAN